MPRIPAIVVGLGALAFLAIQFIRPKISHPPVTADLERQPREAPPRVKTHRLEGGGYNNGL
jgi:hypothetical protein